MAIPQFTGKYASIRKDVYKGTLGQKFDPKTNNMVGRKAYATENGYYKAQAKKFNDIMEEIDVIETTTLPTHATLTIKKAGKGMYGTQWVGELRYTYGNGYNAFVEGERTQGTGYDKLSTAFASALNKSPQFMKILMDARAKGKELPYGVYLRKGMPYLPSWEAGVGMNALNRVLSASGYEVRDFPTGNDVYLYEYTLKKRRA